MKVVQEAVRTREPELEQHRSELTAYCYRMLGAPVERETIRLAFVAALLDSSVASVNSALQRARATLATANVEDSKPSEVDRELLERYVAAFERYDIESLTALIREDATQSMPPF